MAHILAFAIVDKFSTKKVKSDCRSVNPYCRSQTLAQFWQIPEEDRLEPAVLLRQFGAKAAAGAVLRTRSVLRTLLAVERARGEGASQLYDINRHLNIIYAYRHETKLAGVLLKEWRLRGQEGRAA